MCLSIVNEQLFFFIQENESKMSCRIITCLVFFVFTFPCAEGQFPRVCTSLTSLKTGNVAQSQRALVRQTEVHARNWSFVIGPSSTVITNLSSKKTIAMTGLMLFTTKRAKRAGCDLSKCEFGFGLCYTELSVAVSSAFMVLSK